MWRKVWLSVCMFPKEKSVICRQSNMLTSSTPHRTGVKTCGGVWLITPDSKETPKITVTRRKQGWLYSLWKLYLSVWIKPFPPGMSDRLKKCQKVHSECITISAGRHHIAMAALQHSFSVSSTALKNKWFVVDLKPALTSFWACCSSS